MSGVARLLAFARREFDLHSKRSLCKRGSIGHCSRDDAVQTEIPSPTTIESTGRMFTIRFTNDRLTTVTIHALEDFRFGIDALNTAWLPARRQAVAAQTVPALLLCFTSVRLHYRLESAASSLRHHYLYHRILTTAPPVSSPGPSSIPFRAYTMTALTAIPPWVTSITLYSWCG
jgi:hypothetical protein